MSAGLQNVPELSSYSNSRGPTSNFQDGGAIAVDGGAKVEIYTSTFESNTAEDVSE
jgi:hypothetical protein